MSAGRTNAVTGAQLPTLTNPAGAANIQSGYQAISGEGEIIDGTASVKEVATGTLRKNGYSQSSFTCYYLSLTSTESVKITSTVATSISALKGSILAIVSTGSTSNGSGIVTGLEQLVAVRYDNYNSVFVYEITGDSFSFAYRE